jgi:SAM-dependent methyltransferase
MEELFAANRLNWDDRARLHATDTTGAYRIDHAVAGGDTLHAIESAEIGDVSGRRLVHLQCHIGLDTLSLAGRGAIATGLDFSSEAIGAARGFASRARREVRFVHADLYDARQALGATYQVVFVTWGAINWLPDIQRWAGLVSDLLEHGGFLYLAESHPNTLCLEEIDGRIVPHYDWRTPREKPIATDAEATYTGDPRPIAHKRTYEWIHPIGAIVSALIQAGLSLQWLNEHERLPYRLFPEWCRPTIPACSGSPMGIPAWLCRFPLGPPNRPEREGRKTGPERWAPIGSARFHARTVGLFRGTRRLWRG